MQELIDKITKTTGISEDKAKDIIAVISDFVADKYPMLKGHIKNFLGEHGKENDAPQVGGIDITGLG